MKKINLQEGNEALKRALLLMNYDLKKTLSENVEVRQNIHEQVELSDDEVDIIQGLDVATKGIGTDVGALKKFLKQIKNIQMYDRIDQSMNDYTAYSSIEEMLDDEMGVRNYADMQEIRRDLSKIGLDVRFKSTTLAGVQTGVKDITITKRQNAPTPPQDTNTSTDELGPFQNFIKADWGSEIKGNEKYRKEGEFFIVNDGVEDYKYKQDGNTFIYVE